MQIFGDFLVWHPKSYFTVKDKSWSGRNWIETMRLKSLVFCFTPHEVYEATNDTLNTADIRRIAMKTLNEVISVNWLITCRQMNREHLWEIFQNQSLSLSLGMHLIRLNGFFTGRDGGGECKNGVLAQLVFDWVLLLFRWTWIFPLIWLFEKKPASISVLKGRDLCLGACAWSQRSRYRNRVGHWQILNTWLEGSWNVSLLCFVDRTVVVQTIHIAWMIWLNGTPASFSFAPYYFSHWKRRNK